MIDAWTGPTPTPQQFPANEPNGIRKLLDKIKALELQIRESTSNLLGTAGIRLTQLGMFIDSSLTVGGSLDVTGPMTVGGTADFSGDTTIGGNAAITGTLSLPAGIINNDALSSPVKPVWSHADSGASSFAVTTTMTNRATATVTVPTGYTQALIMAAGQASAVNTTASLDTVYVGVSINGTDPPGWASGQDVGPSGFGGATSAVSQLLTGLTGGGTFTIAARIRSAFAGWPANASNEANIDATVLFLR